jgi:hypothetical protein
MKKLLLLNRLHLTLGFTILTTFALPCYGDTMNQPILRREDKDPKAILDSGDKVMVESEPARYLFNQNEWSVDVFGHYAFDTKKGTIDDGFGAGLGVNYFITRFIGVGLEGYGWKGDGLIGSVGANLMLRYPIEQWHLAPYLIGGVSGNFGAKHSEDQVNGSAGVGVEYRFNEHWGVFTDGRYVLTEKTNDYGIARLGIRYAF